MNFEQARSNMVLNQLRANRIRDIDLIEKIEDFPREDLFPKELKHLSYSDQIITLDQETIDDDIGPWVGTRVLQNNLG